MRAPLRLSSAARGQIVVMLALMMVILLGASALVVDLGLYYFEKAQMQNTVDAAALAAASQMPDQIDAEDAAWNILHQNGYADMLNAVGSSMEVIPNPDGDHPGRVQVRLQKQVPAYFARVLGASETTLSVKATSVFMAHGQSRTIVPWILLEDDVNLLVPNQVYDIKQGALGVELGNFGALALGGTGSDIYRDNIIQGCDSIETGDELLTETGNMSGPTQVAVEDRIANNRLTVVCPVTTNPIPNGRDCLVVDQFAVFELKGVLGNGVDSIVQAKFLSYEKAPGRPVRAALID